MSTAWARRAKAWRGRLWLAVALVGVLLLALRVYREGVNAATNRATDGGVESAAADAGTLLDGAPAPALTLTDQFGQRVALSGFRGRAVVLAFVDSRCTTICPLTSATLREMQELLGPAATRVQLLAVNVNAAYNSVADVRLWSAQHGMLHHWLFLTGSPSRLEAVWQAYHVYVQVVSGTLMHDPVVYVIGPLGGERALFETQPSPLSSDIAAQGRDLAAAAAAALHLRVSLTQRGAVPRPHFVVYGQSAGIGAFQVAAAPVGASAHPRQVSVGEGQPALVDFFSTSCVACRQELPVLAAYAHVAATRHLPAPVLVDLAFGGLQYGPALPRNPPYPIVLDSTGALTDAYGVTALPYLAYTSASGAIIWRHVGAGMSLAALERAVRLAGG